ncbi:hypothetical protein D3C80_1480510 [compost metagenome]
MLTTVDDVHHWYWKSFCVESAKVYIQWKIQSVSSCASYCHGYSKNCIRTQFTFVRSSVQSDHQFIDAELVKSVHTDYFWSDQFIYVLNSFEYTFTKVTGFVAIAKLNSFMRTSGCTRRNDCASDCAGLKIYFNFYCRVTTRVKDFACVYVRNNSHLYSLLIMDWFVHYIIGIMFRAN